MEHYKKCKQIFEDKQTEYEHRLNLSLSEVSRISGNLNEVAKTVKQLKTLLFAEVVVKNIYFADAN